jgi:hypothetical protein
MQTLAVIALVIGLILLFRWLGHPTRYLPHEERPKKPPSPPSSGDPPMMA